MPPIITLQMRKWANAGVAMGEDTTGKVIFVPYACPGDTVQVRITKSKSSYSMAVLEKIIIPSPDRISPSCPHFGICGGCSFQHISYLQEIQAKEQLLSEIFRHWPTPTSISLDMQPTSDVTPTSIGADMQPISKNNPSAWKVKITPSPCTTMYRNKATFHATYSQRTLTLGFTKSNSQQVVPIHHCALLPPALNSFKGLLQNIAARITHLEDIVLRISRDQHQILCNILGDKSKRNALIQCLQNSQPLIVQFQQEHHIHDLLCFYNSQPILLPFLSTAPSISANIGSFSYRIGTSDFFQVNYDMAEIIFADMQRSLQAIQQPILFDAYCGSLVIGIQLSPYAKQVVGWEINPEAITRANENIACNHIPHAQVYPCDLQTPPQDLLQKFIPSPLIPPVLVLDPPREGASQLCQQINPLTFQKILYMSCDPMTAQRDITLLSNYQLTSLQGYDMFPRTHHIEILMVLEPKISQNHSSC